MHVCHFCDTSLEGDYFRNIALGLTRRGIRVSLVELGSGTAPKWLSSVPDVMYLSLNATGKHKFPFAVKKLARYLREENVDILHTHLFFSGIIGVLAKKFSPKTTVVLMRHHTGVVRMLGSRVHIAADKWMAEKADHLLTVSEAARQYMLETDGIRRGDIAVIHLGFDFEKLSPSADDRERVRREFGFTDEAFVIGYVANFVNGKGHMQLVESFAKISEQIPNACLFFVGRGMLDDVKSAAAKFPSEKIVFAGWRDDIAACLNAMDLFVQPSLSEAFSQVLIEAMGCGVPVIATDVGGASEVIDNGVNGILIAPDEAAAIELEVSRLYADDSLRKTIAKAGMLSVRERFTADQMVERHFELYTKWLDER